MKNVMIDCFKKCTIFCIASFLVFTATAQKTPADADFKPANVLVMMQKVADWQLVKWDTGGFKRKKYDWTYAAAYAGIMELAAISKEKKYENFLVGIGDDLHWNTGARRFMADDYCVGQLYCKLYAVYKDEKMIAPFRQLADSIVAQPHTESLEWKNGISNREWAWCDALFMAPPSLSYLSTVTSEKKYLDIAVKLWWKTTDYLYDSTEHLYFRDGSYLDKKEKNGKKVFWSRGNGWVAAGLVRVLENMPGNYPDRPRFIRLYKDMMSRVAGLQQADGSWHASLLDPESYPIKETSGTGFYTYAILWGINHKILDKKTYWPIAAKAWKALLSAVHEDGKLGNVQPIGGAPDKVDINSTDTYGPGAFLLAGSQLYKLK
ncbi:MAG: glycoside hydrolase family 88 protein [Bacteroidota bacterium]